MNLATPDDLLIRQRLTQGASATEPEAELARQLRARLLFFSTLVLLPTAATLPLVLTGSVPDPHWQLVDEFHYGCVLSVFAALTLLLARWRERVLAPLRRIEVFTFGFTVVFLVWGQYRFFHSGWLPRVDDPQVMHKIMELTGDSYSFPWFLLIVFYGTCIPNTGWRCALIVSAMTTVALASLLIGGRELGPLIWKVTLSKVVLSLGLGTAIAIYGSHRISVLRRASYEARKLGRYQLKKLLGSGGMGEVYLAEHQLLRRPCAVKIIRPERAGDPQALLRFAREVQATALLTSPYVVEVFDYGHADDGTFYYAMEYLPGISLKELVERFGVLPPERVVHILRQMCLALREAHAHGLIHRDIKPGNIIVGERGGSPDVAKLVDFGLVGEASDNEEVLRLTQAGIVLGSPLYMSPEQVSGAEDLDGRSDLYSLALVAFYLLTGVQPFQRARVKAVFAAQLAETAPRLREIRPSLDADLEDIVQRCLHKDPAQRFESADQLHTALSRCACAGRWTEERARTWWQENLPT